MATNVPVNAPMYSPCYHNSNQLSENFLNSIIVEITEKMVERFLTSYWKKILKTSSTLSDIINEDSDENILSIFTD